MNILFFESSIDPYRGGIQRVTDILYHFLEKEGFNCYFVFYLVDNENIPEDRKMRLDIKASDTVNSSHYIKYLKEKQIDIIINQDQYMNFLIDAYTTIKKEHICKIVNCFHLSPDYFNFYPLSLKAKIKRFLYKLILHKDIRYGRYRNMFDICDKFVLLSKSFEKDFLKLIQVSDSDKLCSISNPLSFELEQPTDIKKKEKIVLIISRYHEVQKNLCAAMRIWKEIEKRGTKGWQLVMGGYGPDEQMLMDYIKELQIENIKILGKVKNPLPYYEKASIFMMTSNFEGFGMTLTEAMQNGCVPMAFDTYTALHDIVTDSVDGMIIPPNYETKYANTLYELMSSDVRRKQMALEAIKTAQKFNISSIGAKWIKMFNELIQ